MMKLRRISKVCWVQFICVSGVLGLVTDELSQTASADSTIDSTDYSSTYSGSDSNSDSNSDSTKNKTIAVKTQISPASTELQTTAQRSPAFTSLESGEPAVANRAVTNRAVTDGAVTDEAVTDGVTTQITPVSQLLDVSPDDWAYQALLSLTAKYGCLAGYPDQTFQGDRTVTRFEFAAGLNACLEQIAGQLTTNTFVSSEDLESLSRLQAEFAAELSTWRDRLDALESRVAEVAAHQFSTTTRLNGLAIWGVQGRTENRADIAPRDGVQDTDDPGTNLQADYLYQLTLSTQFSPRDFLLTGIWASSPPSGQNLTNDGALGLELPIGNTFQISDLSYRRLITDDLAVMVGTNGVDMVRAFRGPNRVESAATGPLSAFAQRNPILNIGFGGGGVALDWQIAQRASLQAIYSTPDLAVTGDRGGLFNGNTTAAAQLLLTPTNNTDLSLYYVNNYSPDGFLLFAAGDSQLTVFDPTTRSAEPLLTHAAGASFNWQLSPRLTLGIWGGYTNSRIPGESGSVETVNYMAYINLPDLFGQGNLAGLYVGQPPKITSSNLPIGNNVPDFLNTEIGDEGGQPGTTIHLEAFYRIRLNDHVSITPGVIHIINPGHTNSSDSVTIGAIRTSFSF